MERLIRKIDKLMRSTFPGAKTELEQLPDEGKVTGFVYWDGFDGEEQIDRQRRVWHVLRTSLTARERQKVSAIFTLTPHEIAVVREG